MERENIRETVYQVIQEIQASSGRDASQLNDSTCPLSDLDGFDSLNAVEASFQLSEYLDHDIKQDLELFSRQGQPLSISEIVDNLFTILNQEQGDEDAK